MHAPAPSRRPCALHAGPRPPLPRRAAPRRPQAGIRVQNTANIGGVTGPSMGSSGDAGGLSSIVALPNDGAGPTAASKLSVGPGFLSFLARKGFG